MSELLIATNPNPPGCRTSSAIPYGGGLVFRAGDTWPRTKAVYCYLINEWPVDAEVVDRVPVRSCVRRGAVAPWRRDRSRPGQGTREPVADRVYDRPWARQRGLGVTARGRIAGAVVEAYRAANPDRDLSS